MHLELDDFPVEIIQRIASHRPCESVLTLARVSRSLYRACNDRQVFKSIISIRNGYDGQTWVTVPLSNDSPTSSWARYALADSAARQWISKGEGIHASLPSQFRLWAPQLMSSSHPLLNSMEPLVLYTAFDNAVGDESYALAFCLTLRLMSRSPRDLIDSTTLQDGTACHNAQEKFRIFLDRGLSGPNKATSAIAINTRDSQSDSRKKSARAVLAVGIISEVLRQGGYTREEVIMPTATEIDFHAMMDPPLPFCPYAPTAMASWHLPKMTSQQFLEDGQWIGLYSCALGATRPSLWDPPMRGIHFTTGINPDLPGRLFLKGSGTDRVGSFDLEGCLITENGSLTMNKNYTPHLHWYWDAFMTPFGIVGTWGNSEWGGWVWLWKVSWLSGQA